MGSTGWSSAWGSIEPSLEREQNAKVCSKVNGHARGPHQCPKQTGIKEKPTDKDFGDRKRIETGEGREGSMDKEMLEQVPAGGGGAGKEGSGWCPQKGTSYEHRLGREDPRPTE